MSRSSQRSTIKDMTNGSPAKLILGFAVPMLMGLLFQQFYSMSIRSLLENFSVSMHWLRVGSTSAINFMITGFVIGVCTGFSIPVAQRFGAQDYKDMRRFVANAGWIASCFAVVMTVIVCLMTRQILVWMQTPDNIIDGAYSYIFFVFAGIPATYLYNTLAGITVRSATPKRRSISDFIQPFKHCAGSAFHRTDRNRHRRSCLCNCYLSSSIRYSLPDLYEEKI